MSSLLEQAIVDANALKEAALKNAENIVVEKYADEVKSVLDTLLEQDDLTADPLAAGAAGLGGDALGTGALGGDLGAGDLGGGDPLLGDLGGAEVESAAPAPPTVSIAPSTQNMIDNFPSSFLSEDLFDDTEKVLIDLDKLQEELEISGVSELDVIDEGDLIYGDISEMGYEINADILEGEVEETDMYEADLGVEETDMYEADLGVEEADMYELGASDAEIQPAPPPVDPAALDGDPDVDIVSELADEIYESLNFDMDEDLTGFDHLGLPPSQAEEEAMKAELAKDNDEDDDPVPNEDAERAKEEAKEAKNEALTARLALKSVQKENKQITTQNQKILEENSKLMEAVEFLNNKLQETNLANAKLLYINQTQGNASLNERQKEKIVEAISKSDSIEEAKVIYETLQSTVGEVKTSMPKSLSEAINKRSSLMVPGKREQQNSGSPLYERMQRLAGIRNY